MKPRFIIRDLLLIMAGAVWCFWPFLPGLAAESGPLPPPSAPAPSSPAAIPLSEIATRASEVNAFIHTVHTQLVPAETSQTILTQLPNVRLDMDRELEETTELLWTEPTLEQLQAKQRYWHERRLLLSGWLKTLTVRASQVNALLDQLVERQKVWTQTSEAARATNTPLQVLQQIDTVTTSLGAVRIPLDVLLKDALDLQAAVAREVSRCESIFSEIVQAQQKAVGGLLTRDTPPIWSPELWNEGGKSLPETFRRVIDGHWREIHRYVWGTPRTMLIDAGFFVAMALLFGAAGRKVRRWELSDEKLPSGLEVFDYPWSAAYIASIIYLTGPISSAPDTIKSLLKVAAFVPMIRLATLLGTKVAPGGYIAGILFGLEVLRQFIAGTPVIEQFALALETVAGTAILASALARGHFKPAREHVERTAFDRTLPILAVISALGLGLGFLAGILGYMRLARMLSSTVLGVGFLVLFLYSSVRILMGLVGFGLVTRPFGRLRMVQHHRDLLIRRAHRTMAWSAFFVGLMRLLDHLGLFQPALALGGAILTTKLERGALSISVGDIFAFFVTVCAAYLSSIFFRFVLQEDVYPRLGVPVGLSYAASILLHYVVLAFGVVVGLAVLGVDLTKLTVLAGALGVGIGFGLQSVVNNFVSGLILLFERPIHVGDSIEVGEHKGEVRRIGIRASTIRTRQGAEIIIPNAQLVTDKVTNWTLSDQLRRIELTVGVNYGAPPNEVIRMLERVALDHRRVMRNPPPHGLFVGFGDSSLDFELRAWTDESEDWARIRSDLAVAVHDAVAEAGWTIPFPQREVRLLKNPKS